MIRYDSDCLAASCGSSIVYFIRLKKNKFGQYPLPVGDNLIFSTNADDPRCVQLFSNSIINRLRKSRSVSRHPRPTSANWFYTRKSLRYTRLY